MKKGISVVILLVIFIESICFAQSTNFQADSQLYIDIDGDGIKEDIWLDGGVAKDNEYGTLATKYSLAIVFKNGKRLVLENASETEGMRPAVLMDITISEEIPSMIGIAYSAGAHLGLLDIFLLKSGEIVKDIEILSDAPFLEMKDTDNDGIKEIEAYNRDYTENPMRDGIVSVYKYENGEWSCVSEYKTTG